MKFGGIRHNSNLISSILNGLQSFLIFHQMDISKIHLSIAGSEDRIMMADIHMPALDAVTSLVIYAHGINGFKDWGDMDLIARRFAAEGHAFLKFNFSHSVTTPEHSEDFKDLEAYGNDNYLLRQNDLRKLFDHLEAHPDFKSMKIFSLIGHSRGGTDAILFAASDSRLKALITWAAVAQARTPWRNWNNQELEEWRENGVRFLKNSRTGQNMPVYYQLYEEYQQHSRQLDVERAAREIDIPWLICHGSEDESVFVKDAYSLKEWQPGADVFIIPDTGHTFGRSHPWKDSHLPAPSQELVDESIKFLAAQS